MLKYDKIDVSEGTDINLIHEHLRVLFSIILISLKSILGLSM